jgi:hypothetical protein
MRRVYLSIENETPPEPGEGYCQWDFGEEFAVRLLGDINEVAHGEGVYRIDTHWYTVYRVNKFVRVDIRQDKLEMVDDEITN